MNQDDGHEKLQSKKSREKAFEKLKKQKEIKKTTKIKVNFRLSATY